VRLPRLRRRPVRLTLTPEQADQIAALPAGRRYDITIGYPLGSRTGRRDWWWTR